MKIHRFLLLLFIILLISAFLFSCGADVGGGANDENGGETPTIGDAIYRDGTKLSVIFAEEHISDETVFSIVNRLYGELGAENVNYYVGEVPAESEHEIVIGRCEREISKRAYALLERQDYDELGDVGYLVYSSGSSLAIAYTESFTYGHLEEFILSFAEENFDSELSFPVGTVKRIKTNVMADIEAEDAERTEAAWARVEAKAGPAVAEALKELYSLYTPGVITWLANLYEPRVCVCTATDGEGNRICLHPEDENGKPLCSLGGFYYSNSARDTVGYLPDVESTNQALSFLESSGMLATLGGGYADNIPATMRNDIIGFVKGLQDENGYFYHPQWSKEIVDKNYSRRGRDLDWASSILKRLGAKPYYTTPLGVEGEGKPEVRLTAGLGLGKVSAVSRVICAAAPYPAHLESGETLAEYLSGLDINHNSYPVGNEIAAQSAQIKARDQQLGGELSQVLFKWFADNQNPKNGLWDEDSDYYATDGMFKIVTVYNSFGVPMKYGLEAAMATIDSILSDEQVGTVCNMYNAWHNVGLIKTNLRSYSTDKRLAEEQIKTIDEAILSRAPEAIRITLEKTKNFLIDDGSFSYLIGHSSETSQGMPTAVLNTLEGDMNATLICVGGLIGNINAALNLPKVNPYGLKDWYVFLDIIEENGNSIKDGTLADKPLTFEDDAVEEKPANVETGVLSDGFILVASDPKKDSNKVLELYHPYAPGKGDYLRFTNYNHWLNRPCTIFESDFYIDSEKTDDTYVAQILLGSAYYFTLRLEDGKVGIWEDSSTELIKTRSRHLADADTDEWFNLRIEYYNGTHETVRIKVYLDGELIAISANYANGSGAKLQNGTGTPAKGFEKVTVYPLSYVNIDMYLDNVLVTSTNDPYVKESDAVGLAVNEDIEPRDRVTYTLDGDALPEDITLSSGSATVKDGALQLSSGAAATLKIPVNVRTPLPNCYSFGFDIDFTDAKDGEALTFSFTAPYPYEGKTVNITSLSLKCVTEGGEKYLLVTSKAGAVTYANTRIAVSDEPTSFEFLHFSTEMQTLIYKDGEFMGLTNYVTFDFPARFELGYITLTHSGKADITLDDLFVEARKESFDTETEPPVDRIVYDFEDDVGEGVTTDGTVSNGVLTLEDQEISIPVNKRVETPFSVELSLDATLCEGKYTRTSFTDRNGNIIFSLDMSYADGALSLFEVTASGRHAAVAEYATEPVFGLKVTYFPDNGIVTVTLGETCILATSLLYSEGFGEAAYAVISSDGIAIDNVTLEALVFNYSDPSISVENGDDGDEVLTYEGSSTGNMPSRVTATLVTSGADAAIRLMMKATEESKVLAFTTSQGGCDYIDFVIPNDERSRRLVFETELCFAIDGYYEINVLNSTNGSKNAYRPILSGRGGWVYYYDVATNGGANPGKEVKIAKMGEWVTFTLEVDLGYGDAESPRMITRINGEVVYDSRNYVGSLTGAPALPDLNRVRFYTHTSSTGTLYFDNTLISVGDCLHGACEEGEVISHPTCDEDGERSLVCKYCGELAEETVSIPAVGHEMGEWTAHPELPYTEVRGCKNCSYTETRELEPPAPPTPDEPETPTDDRYIDGGAWTPVGKKEQNGEAVTP